MGRPPTGRVRGIPDQPINSLRTLVRPRHDQPTNSVGLVRDLLESGAEAPSAAAGKRRVDFSAPAPPSKRAWVVSPSKRAWVVPGIGAGWLRWLAQGEREAREAEVAAAAAAERCR